MNNNQIQKLILVTSEDACLIDGDPRNLYYEVKNWKIF